MAAESVDGLIEKAPPLAGHGLTLGGRRVGLNALPQFVVQRNPRVECAHLRLHRIKSGPQFGVSSHGLQVADHAHGVVQRLGQPVKRVHAVLVSAFARLGGDRLQSRSGLRQQFGRCRCDVGGAYAVEGNAEFDREERIGWFGAGHPLKVSSRGRR